MVYLNVATLECGTVSTIFISLTPNIIREEIVGGKEGGAERDF